jgi:hypothetical protein
MQPCAQQKQLQLQQQQQQQQQQQEELRTGWCVCVWLKRKLVGHRLSQSNNDAL